MKLQPLFWMAIGIAVIWLLGTQAARVGALGRAPEAVNRPAEPTEPVDDPASSGVPGLVAHRPSAWEARMPSEIRKALQHAEPAFELSDPGTASVVVDYARYGRFQGVGTKGYLYEILDRKGLARAVGEGIYPNTRSVRRNPAFRDAFMGGRLKGSVWEFSDHPNAQLSFFKWASTTTEAPGVVLFYTAKALEEAGLLAHAVKAYHAILVHFSAAVGWTEFQTPWYVGEVARDRLEAILRLHPELGVQLEEARVLIRNRFDNDVDNDVVVTWPGRLTPGEADEAPPAIEPVDLSRLAIRRDVGQGRVRLRQYENGHWQLLVDGRPRIIRGLSYSPSAVGESHDEGTVPDWMVADRNGNGRLDGPFDTFMDRNGNNRQDPDEPTVGDFQLMKDMGVNTLRLYHHASNTALLRQLHDEYGIMVMMGDLVGMYTVGSGAVWEDGTDYLDPVQRRRMTESVQQMVREFKDEPYILMWMLGNENNYGGVHGIVGGVGNAAEHPEAFYAFLNELAEWIHAEDPDHPVAVVNGEILFLDVIERVAPAIDVFGVNVYRGWHGFGSSLFEAVRDTLDKPVLITEFGCPAYQAGQSRETGELGQALYHAGNWIDLAHHVAGRGVGNALGGVVFAWVDEWWKAGQPPRFSPSVHETIPNWSGPFPGGKNYEEWFGVTGQGDGRLSPYLRAPRAAYRLYQHLWQ